MVRWRELFNLTSAWHRMSDQMEFWNTVKVKAGKKVASRVNTNARSHPLRNRVSDGFVIM